MTMPYGTFDPDKVGRFITGAGHSAKLGLIYRDSGDNWAELELPFRDDLVGEADRDVLATGPIVSLFDMASGLSIWIASKEFRPVATLDLRVDYQRPAREKGGVVARVECYRLTRSAAFVRGVAHDGDPQDSIATMAGVFMTIAMDPRLVR